MDLRENFGGELPTFCEKSLISLDGRWAMGEGGELAGAKGALGADGRRRFGGAGVGTLVLKGRGVSTGQGGVLCWVGCVGHHGW